MDIVRNGIIMTVYLFVIIALFIFLSSPFDDLMDTFEDIDSSASDARVESASSYGRTVFNMVFAGLAIVPMLWFMVWVFRTEPDWRYK